jgi:hyaluronate lyase
MKLLPTPAGGAAARLRFPLRPFLAAFARPLLALGLMFALAASARADAYDTVRDKWLTMMTGGTTYNTADPDIAARITSITNSANSQWSSMLKTGGTGRAYLWSDLTSTTNSSQVTTNYNRLRTMALAYGTHGSSLQGNATLLTDILGGLDWMYANRYNTTIAEYDNWWDWDIGSPLALNDTMVLIYAGLSGTQKTNFCASIDHYLPAPDRTGANRVWTCTVVAVRGMVEKNNAKLVAARDGLSPVFPYTYGDGFHLDGSFIQHTAHPYNGGYGTTMLQLLAPFITALQGSTWAVTDPAQAYMYQWIYDAYAPFLYKGGFMSFVRGREISRSGSQDHNTGQKIMEYLLRWTDMAPAADALAYKRMIKYWMQQDTFRSFIPSIGNIDLLIKGQAIRDDSAILPMAEPVSQRQFPEMDRVVHQRPGFGFGVSLYSSRIYNYESINSENLHAWHTGSGMTYLFNGDLGHYDQDYWPTVNPYRLPGTTVDTQTLADSANAGQKSNQSWVGGAEILGLYGVTGTSLKSQGNTLVGKKSWFMFDDEVVALGADITSTDSRTIETTVENRRITTTTNALTVNGTAQPTSPLPWSATLTSVNWMHLAGSGAGADIGYYFPTATTLKALRETRAANWDSIGTGSATSISRNYVTIWRDHGTNPAAATYAYVLLPGKTTTQVSAYATSPDIAILENSSTAQAVKETKLNVVAVNFWADATKTVDLITSNKKASVIAKENAGQDIEIAVSDPTQLGTTTAIEIARSASAVLYQDSRITVTQLSPTIKFTVNVAAGTPNTDAGNGIRGHAWKVKFNLAPAKVPTTTTGWFNVPMLPQAGAFTVEFDATPSASPLNSVMGLSNNLAAGYADVATAVRFSSTGVIDARNGAAYAAATSIPFTAGTRYHFRLIVNLATHTYSAYVTPAGGSELTIGAGYAFRTEQAAVAQLNNWASIADPTIAGSVSLADFVVRNSTTDVAGYLSIPTEKQGGTFTATFDAVPSVTPFNGVVGFSAAPAAAWADIAVAVRFSPTGAIDARNGGAYQAAQTIPFAAGLTYRFRVVINVPAHTYSVYVTPPDGRELVVGVDYAFRTEQAGVTSLNYLAMNVDLTTPGTITASRVALIDTALCAWLPLDDTGSVAFDESRHLANATVVNGPLLTAGARGSALDFDGVNDHLTLPSGMADFSGGLTIALWAYPATVKNNARFVDFGNGSASNNILFARNASTNDLSFWIYTGSTAGAKTTAAGALTLNTWQRFAVTVDAAGNVKLYKNGTQVATGTTTLPTNIARTLNYIGRSNTAADAYFDGALDDIRIYNRALTAAEIANLP